MSSTITRSSSNSLSKDSRVIFGNHAGARVRVASATTTTVTVDSVAELTGTSLYSRSRPGQLEILTAVAGTSHQGKTARIIGISGAVLTVDQDFSTGTILAAGDIIAITPPLSVEAFLNQGHTVNDRLANDYAQSLNATFDEHNTAMGVDVDGDIPFFQTMTSEAFARFLLFGIGSYKTVRTVADGATNSNTTVTSATAAFVSSDVGKAIAGGTIPASTTVTAVVSATQVTISAAASGTATGVTLTIGTAGTHRYRPMEANDGGFTDLDEGTLYSQDGNGVLRKMFFGLFGTRLTLDYPENARGVGTVGTLGNGVAREIGGSGKVFSSGVNATRTVTDGVLNSTTTLTSATAAFVSTDVGAKVVGTGIPTGTFIASVTNGTTVVMTQAATATASGVTVTISTENYIRSDFACDTGAGVTFRSAFVELGGAYGAGLTSAVLTTVKNATVTVERAAVQDRTLGDAYIVKPEEDMFTLTVSGTRILSNDDFYELSQGGATDANPGNSAKGETRMLLKAISPNDPTKSLTVDIPRGVFSVVNTERQRGRYLETFEYRMLATVDAATGCVSTATPPVEFTLVNGISKNLATTI